MLTWSACWYSQAGTAVGLVNKMPCCGVALCKLSRASWAHVIRAEDEDGRAAATAISTASGRIACSPAITLQPCPDCVDARCDYST